MRITHNGGADQNEDAGPDNCADAESREIPDRQRFLETMLGMFRIGKALFDRFRSKEAADHNVPCLRRDGIGCSGINDPGFIWNHVSQTDRHDGGVLAACWIL